MVDRLAVDGGPPVRRDFLVFGRPVIGTDEIAEVVDSLQSGWIGRGPKVTRFEDAFGSYLGAEHAAAVSSGTAALQLALLAAGVRADDEVIIPTMTFAATANAVIHTGATPVFVDVDESTQNVTVAGVQAALTERTRAILPVHFAGYPCDMVALAALARDRGLWLIDDAAHCIEGWSGGHKIGTVGDATCFSFYVTKNLTTSEGGMVTTANPAWIERVKVLASNGLSSSAWHRYADEGFRHYEVVAAGYKHNMTDLQAAIGIHQVARLGERADRRAEIWSRYDQAFDGCPVRLPAQPMGEGDVHARHLYVLRLDLDQLRVDRDVVAEALRAENIGVGIHYVALHLQPYYRDQFGLRPEQFPWATASSARCLSLPLDGVMTDGDVDDVVTAVHKVLHAYG